MSVRVEFTLSGRPIPWERPRHRAGQVAMFNSKRVVAAKNAVATAAKAAMRAAGRAGAPLTGPLKLEVLCVYEVPVSWTKGKQAAAARGFVWKSSVPDWDNLGKLISDGLNGIVYTDDAQIAVSTVAKRHGAPERTVIRVSELPAWEDAFAASGLPGSQTKLPL